MGVNHYPVELREQVLTEYECGLGGYRTLAKRHGLKRDTVRDWVKAYGSKEGVLYSLRRRIRSQDSRRFQPFSNAEIPSPQGRRGALR